MLQTLKDLFNAVLPPQSNDPPERAEHALRLATAVLLVEVMRSDADLSPDERDQVLSALRGRFALSDDEGARLLELAHQAAHGATDFFQFTSKINDSFDMDQKIGLVEQMWQVAYADGILSSHENHVMRRLSDLLHVPHGAYVSAKMRAKLAAGVD
ncbi:MAG: TerB family tellurite resistance protein [Burkholderiaceae bacterium]|nr:TerB family tellurite resistance protein [Burkholderiaceae bacterium]